MSHVNGRPDPLPPGPVCPPAAVSSADLFERLYGQLRGIADAQLARLRPGETLQSTALIHEAFIKLSANEWGSEREFFCVAAAAMRSIIVDKIRSDRRHKRGGDRLTITLSGLDPEDSRVQSPDEVLFIEEVIARIERVDPELSELILLRYYAGLSLPRISTLMAIPLRTLERRWQFVRALVSRDLQQLLEKN